MSTNSPFAPPPPPAQHAAPGPQGPAAVRVAVRLQQSLPEGLLVQGLWISDPDRGPETVLFEDILAAEPPLDNAAALPVETILLLTMPEDAAAFHGFEAEHRPLELVRQAFTVPHLAADAREQAPLPPIPMPHNDVLEAAPIP